MGKKMGRPPVEIDDVKLRVFMRFKPTLNDTAAYFEVNPSTVENYIRKKFDLTFSEFRDQNMVHTRFMLIRTAIKKAENGDNVMLIFCLKNLCGWKDKPAEEENDPFKNMTDEELKKTVKRLVMGKDAA
jgi:hypothetical protein